MAVINNEEMGSVGIFGSNSILMALKLLILLKLLKLLEMLLDLLSVLFGIGGMMGSFELEGLEGVAVVGGIMEVWAWLDVVKTLRRTGD